MAKLKKTMLAAGLVTLGLIATAAGAAYGWLLHALPPLDGDITLAKLAAPAGIASDAHGIPVISAGSRVDAARVLGYVVARDRLFQMDLMRRKNAGRLAEIFGEVAVNSDVRARTYGYSQKVKQILPRLPPLHRQYLQAYAEGVNGYLAQKPTLPFEFKVLGYEPEPWRAEDSLLVVFGMFENLTAWAEDGERMLSVMEQTLPADAVAFLTPDTDRFTDVLMKHKKSLRPARPVPVDAMQTLLAARAADFSPRADASAGERLAGSNAWAVSGGKTADGRAILANDMHLGIGVPNIWYRVEVNYPGARAIGLNLPGTPFLIAGSNPHVAWGMTNLTGDFLDLVKLEIKPDDPGQYRVGEHWQAFGRRDEVITVKGGASKTLTVKETVWGPVALQPLLGQPVAIHWVALDQEAVNVDILELEQSQTLSQALDIANRAGGPQLNMVFADDRGHIAWTLTGKIPKRFGGDGLVSRSWADGKTGWQGYLQPAQLPRSIDPPEGFLVSANDRRFAADFPYLIGHQFANGYRAYRIHQQLERAARHSEWSLFNLQQDTESEFYGYYQQLALTVLPPDVLAQKPELAALRDYLLSWNGRADTPSLGLPVLIEFRRQLIDAVLTPFMSACKQADNDFVYAWHYVDTPLQALLEQKPAGVLPAAGRHRNWDRLILAQLEISAAKVRARNPGLAWSELTWGSQNRVGHAHPFSKALPFLSALLDMPKQPLAGCGGYCVRVTGPDFGASERLVVSPGHFEDGILHMPGGQSAHPLSPYYGDQQPFWLAGLPLAFPAGKPEHKLRLWPDTAPFAGQKRETGRDFR